jgi:hypothetical protein
MLVVMSTSARAIRACSLRRLGVRYSENELRAVVPPSKTDKRTL